MVDKSAVPVPAKLTTTKQVECMLGGKRRLFDISGWDGNVPVVKNLVLGVIVGVQSKKKGKAWPAMGRIIDNRRGGLALVWERPKGIGRLNYSRSRAIGLWVEIPEDKRIQHKPTGTQRIGMR